jgi:hypothetical protein
MRICAEGIDPMERREFLAAGVSMLSGTLGVIPGAVRAQRGLAVPSEAKHLTLDNLYNGICLTAPWPPRSCSLSLEPVPVPCLRSGPAVIRIDLGRQLLVDDFLIEKTTLQRTFHRAQYHPASPVLKPDKPWE